MKNSTNQPNKWDKPLRKLPEAAAVISLFAMATLMVDWQALELAPSDGSTMPLLAFLGMLWCFLITTASRILLHYWRDLPAPPKGDVAAADWLSCLRCQNHDPAQNTSDPSDRKLALMVLLDLWQNGLIMRPKQPRLAPFQTQPGIDPKDQQQLHRDALALLPQADEDDAQWQRRLSDDQNDRHNSLLHHAAKHHANITAPDKRDEINNTLLRQFGNKLRCEPQVTSETDTSANAIASLFILSGLIFAIAWATMLISNMPSELHMDIMALYGITFAIAVTPLLPLLMLGPSFLIAMPVLGDEKVTRFIALIAEKLTATVPTVPQAPSGGWAFWLLGLALIPYILLLLSLFIAPWRNMRHIDILQVLTIALPLPAGATEGTELQLPHQPPNSLQELLEAIDKDSAIKEQAHD